MTAIIGTVTVIIAHLAQVKDQVNDHWPPAIGHPPQGCIVMPLCTKDLGPGITHG